MDYCDATVKGREAFIREVSLFARTYCRLFFGPGIRVGVYRCIVTACDGVGGEENNTIVSRFGGGSWMDDLVI